MEDGVIAYVYDANHEDAPVYAISRDRGVTRRAARASNVLSAIPSLVRWTHMVPAGRNGGAGDGLVLYTSDDGIKLTNALRRRHRLYRTCL